MNQIEASTIKGEGVRKGSIYMLLGYGISSTAFFLFQVLCARNIGSEEFGKLGVFYSLILILSHLSGSGFRDTIGRILPEKILHSKEELEQFKKISLYTFYVWTGIYTFILLLLSPIFYLFLNKNFLSSLLLFFSLIFYSSSHFLIGFLLGYRKISYIALTTIIPNIFLVFLSLIVSFIYPNLLLYEFSITFMTLLTLFTTFVLLKPFISFRSSLLLKKNKTFLPIRESFEITTVNTINNSYFAIGIILLRIANVPYAEIGLFTAMLTLFQVIKNASTSIFIPLYPNLSYALSSKNIKLFFHYIKRVITILLIGLFILILCSLSFLVPLWSFIFKKDFLFERIDFLFLSVILTIYLYARLLTRVLFVQGKINATFKVCILTTFLFALLYFILPFSPIKSIEFALFAGSFFYSLFTSIIFLKKIKSIYPVS